ncbi:hypothetical protein ROE7235_03619 [Roseibaca ekhonensis]|uniref:HNH nuclease domain-containing protein n=1 Tax=Roseinatronobacter ekhonensis TaxID=254356 RepID=A0A3B0MYQ8_9RHOB|nr:HNH endonuclease signature motif containing protein [Roseibaca ekhonensis]SUZ33844.1 hypothetical protein ROE7235_03619 [Roseibaca ekhonensis]
MKFEIGQELQVFSDHVAPVLGVYEQAIFIYLFRHSYLEGSDKVTIGMRTAAKKMGFGSGDGSRPMSEATMTKKIQSLEDKGLIKKIDSGRTGTVLHVKLPTETEYFRIIEEAPEALSVEDLDFFKDPVGREAILIREGSRCFYCFASLDRNNYVMEHVVSRPEGDGGYKNIVAACRSCNNKKSEKSADTHLRNLYRARVLSEEEFQERLQALDDLGAGKLIPDMDAAVALETTHP